ncbi:MAG: tRNA pseudouridine(55) synthase TruB [Oscillospiraceae bacterium]|jgi:tRNA pseudouridine55 synthase|nr:tRNA pseudouridine(55) synthase TruB [Oscillospiraceae bacterium]
MDNDYGYDGGRDPFSGFLNLLKPPGMTSSDAVQTIKRALRVHARKLTIGHAGTLDPEAAGVLPIMLGRGTRLFEYLTDKRKEYIAEWIPGASTDTQDSAGRITAVSDYTPTLAELERVLPRFTGVIKQTPPVYSALKRGGAPLYRLARKGVAVEPEPREARVDSLEWIGETSSGRMLRVVCGRGVYVRSLCQSIGEAAGCAAHMGFLLRTRAGMFSIDNGVTIEETIAAVESGGEGLPRLRALLSPLDAPVMDLPRAESNAPESLKALLSGAALNRRTVSPRDAPDGLYRLYAGGMYAGVARMDAERARLVYRMI